MNVPRPLVWKRYRGMHRTCECRLHAEELDADGNPRPNVSRTGYRHRIDTMYYRVPFSRPFILIGCLRYATRYTKDDRGVRWWFCDYCAPPVVDSEWYRRVFDPDSLQPPHEAWNEQCWACICSCRECHDKPW